MDVNEIRAIVADRFPRRYEPLNLTFYGCDYYLSDDYVVIGDDYGTQLCVRLSDGIMLSIDPKGSLHTRFMNSSIEQFARFVEVCLSYAERPKEKCDRLMWKELAVIDLKAFAKAENWWACILEQIRDGLL
jgi:hypothetical protein